MSSKWKVKRPAQAPPPRPRRKGARPVLVWVICIFYGLEAIGSPLGLLIFARFPASSPHYLAPATIPLMVVGLALSLATVVALYRLKRVALPLWIATFAVELANRAIAATRPVYRTYFLSPPRLAVLVVGYAIEIAIIIYISSLSRNGMLHD